MGLQPALTTRRTVRIVSTHDSCIDRGASNIEEYAKTWDLKHLTIVEDEENPPVWFNIQPISHDTRDQLAVECRCEDPNIFTDRLVLETARVACYRIDGHTVTNEKGKKVPLTRSQRESVPGGIKRLRDVVWREFPSAVWIEVGLAAWQISGLWDEHSKNSLPPACTEGEISESSESHVSGATSDPTSKIH